MEIVLQDIAKQYGEHWIFQHIQARFETGHVYPIIGNNGSGKSTLLQIISGYVTPNLGKITHRKDLEDIPVEEWYRHTSIAAPYLDLFEEFTVEESIALHMRMKPMMSGSVEHILEEIDLAMHRKKTLKQLSSGMRQRLKLALAIMSNTELLLLDEPCSNLDQQWMAWYNTILAQFTSDRVTIICSNSQQEELKLATAKPLDVSASTHRG